MQPVSDIQGIWPSATAERIYATNSLSASDTAILYTVPANRKLFISNGILTSRNLILQVASSVVFVRNAEDDEAYRMLAHYFSLKGQECNQHNFFPALEATAGFDVCMRNLQGNFFSRATIFGWLEVV